MTSSLGPDELHVLATWHAAIAASVKALHDEMARATAIDDALAHLRQLLACAKLLTQMSDELLALAEHAGRD